MQESSNARTEAGTRVSSRPASRFPIPSRPCSRLASTCSQKRKRRRCRRPRSSVESSGPVPCMCWWQVWRLTSTSTRPATSSGNSRDPLAGEVEYAFKHTLTREVAYGSLTKARRARLHMQFAEWLERLGEGRDEHAPLLAHHYAEAVRPEDVDVAWPEGGTELEGLRAKAVEWLDRAAEGAIARYE